MNANKPVKNQHENKQPKQWSSLPTLSSRLLNKAFAVLMVRRWGRFISRLVHRWHLPCWNSRTWGCSGGLWLTGMIYGHSVVVNHIGYRAQVIEPNNKFTPLGTSTHDILNYYNISSSPQLCLFRWPQAWV